MEKMTLIVIGIILCFVSVGPAAETMPGTEPKQETIKNSPTFRYPPIIKIIRRKEIEREGKIIRETKRGRI